jgi:dihydroxy-acid dehydratase
MNSRKKPRLRSQDWFGKADRDGFMHRSWMKGQGHATGIFASSRSS